MKKVFLISLIAFGLVFSVGFSTQPTGGDFRIQDLGGFHM